MFVAGVSYFVKPWGPDSSSALQMISEVRDGCVAPN
jgi:hypothetical protein